VFLTEITTHSLERTGFSSHGHRSTQFICRALRALCFWGFVDHDDLSFILLHLVHLVGHLTLPCRICQVIASFIWFGEPMHLCRISQAFLPNFVTDDLHFEKLEKLKKLGRLRCSSFTPNFCEIHINLTNKLWTALSRLLCYKVLNVDYMLCKLLYVDTSGVVDL